MTEAATDPALRLSGVRKSFKWHLGIGSVPVLHGVSFSVEPGTIHGLLGPNGAGKTTTIRIVLGLIRPDAGSVELFGRPSGEPEARRGLGFLPENPYFYDYLTAREFMDFSARLAGVPRDARRGEIDRLLETVGMTRHADLPLRRCSKGMVQRVGMAQALLGDPRIVILDEPMSGLDPVGRRQFRDLILDQRRQGRTVFFSSHILQDAEMICDRVSILDRGRLVAQGDLGTLLGREVRFWEVTLFGWDGAKGDPAWEEVPTTSPGTLLRVRSETELDRLLKTAEGAGSRVRSVVPCRDTLEDLFLKEIGKGGDA